MARPEDQQVVSITTAPHSRAADIAQRQRHYLFSMGLRTLCFVGAIAVGPGLLRWVLVAGALVLPSVAVVLANRQAPQRPVDRVTTPGPEHHQALGRGTPSS